MRSPHRIFLEYSTKNLLICKGLCSFVRLSTGKESDKIPYCEFMCEGENV